MIYNNYNNYFFPSSKYFIYWLYISNYSSSIFKQLLLIIPSIGLLQYFYNVFRFYQ